MNDRIGDPEPLFIVILEREKSVRRRFGVDVLHLPLRRPWREWWKRERRTSPTNADWYPDQRWAGHRFFSPRGPRPAKTLKPAPPIPVSEFWSGNPSRPRPVLLAPRSPRPRTVRICSAPRPTRRKSRRAPPVPARPVERERSLHLLCYLFTMIVLHYWTTFKTVFCGTDFDCFFE